MASFHLSVQVVKRSIGRSVVAMAAYRSGQSLNDVRAEKVQDYTRRRGVAHAEVMAPKGSPDWMLDREKLWNYVEAVEKRKDAQLAREVNLALPAELSAKARLALVRQFVEEQFVSQGMVADIALHDPVPEKGDDARNYHAHVLLTLRKATPTGLDAKKERDWNSDLFIKGWRKAWADLQNAYLEKAGFRTRVDHRSLREQREDAIQRGDRRAAALLDRKPEIHVGPKARAAARRGRTLVSQERRQGFRNQPIRGPLPSYAYPSFDVRSDPEARNSRKGKGRDRQAGTERSFRSVNYPAFDKGNRVTYLSSIIYGNNEKARLQALKIDRQVARLRRRFDYWEKGFSWTVEGKIKGAQFRRQRALTAAEEKLRKAHGEKRKKQIRELIKELTSILTVLRGGRESVLARRRAVDSWTLQLGRQFGREKERGRDLFH